MAVKRMAFVMYPVTDLARSTAFYEETLGLQKSGLENQVWVEFDVDGTTFGIGNFEQVGTPGTAASLALEVDDIRAMRSTLAGKGVEAAEPTELPNCWVSALSDPDGNRVWLHQLK